ncbi:hypothetical protein INR75_09360 [Zunongwangia sp. SCSIO 43204]|uniref:hypothetical protein n=1 Tax=Zunongwangia sp. SCSIO 43204 TaxID=2779359 RepID=UPI001CA85020|nr:hypothetical protein [Zunongwangia sp. SCSIO 43204]UAB86178.1 hypothetical protein INR75_09360 [Zunongwangia sp. SCSIO 43204]
MRIKSIFNKRNYIHLYHKYKAYPNSVNCFSFNHELDCYKGLLESVQINKFEKVIAIASGPSSKKVILNDKNLYFCCNNSIQLLKESGCYYLYTLSDDYYVWKYLKTFEKDNYWLSTIFYFYLSKSTIKKRNLIATYLENYSRGKPEVLVTNDTKDLNSNRIYSDIQSVFEKWNYKHFGVNSGFNNLVLAAVAAHFLDLPLISYGLDMGIGGEEYFDHKTKLGHSIKGDFSKRKVYEFISIVDKEIDFENFSNFKLKK